MHCVRQVTEDLYWVGANDRRLALFENIFPIQDGVSYNSYLLLDEKTVLFDTVDWSVGRQLVENVEFLLAGRPLDYLVVNHMEPDHCGTIDELVMRYPGLQIISSEKSFMFMHQFGYHVEGHEIQVKEGDCFSFGAHEVTFIAAPMVHWPEVIVTFDKTNGVLFSADAFGSFKTLDGRIFADEVDWDRDYLDEARRYLTNIVGKYGPQVQRLLGKAAPILDQIKYICPLHGFVWRKDFGYLLDKYNKWSRYEPEVKGVMIAYASMYGNTEQACEALAVKLADRGVTDIKMHDVSKSHVSFLISDTFKYSHIVLGSVTYNLGVYPIMHNYLYDMKALNLQNRTFAIVENGSWAVRSGDIMSKYLNEECKNMTVLNERLSLASSLLPGHEAELDAFADAIAASVLDDAQK